MTKRREKVWGLAALFIVVIVLVTTIYAYRSWTGEETLSEPQPLAEEHSNATSPELNVPPAVVNQPAVGILESLHQLPALLNRQGDQRQVSS